MKQLNFGRDGILPFVKHTLNIDSVNAVEVGVFKGHYTKSYFSHLNNSTLYLVDLWEIHWKVLVCLCQIHLRLAER